jgi:hypothetical protein
MPDRRSDVAIVRDQITREVSNDAFAIASQVFSTPEPDVTRVTSQQIDDRYRRAFVENDRPYLISEAQRDPKQFLEATGRLGVVMPPDKPLSPPEPPLPQPAQAAPPLPQPPPTVLPEATPVPPEVLSAPTTPAPPPLAAPPPALAPPPV